MSNPGEIGKSVEHNRVLNGIEKGVGHEFSFENAMEQMMEMERQEQQIEKSIDRALKKSDADLQHIEEMRKQHQNQ